ALTLASTDPSGDPLSYTITTQPTDGQLSGSGANLTYTPNAGFTGSDGFQFTATDAATGLVSNSATASLSVGPPPVASGQSVTTNPGVSISFTLASSDPNGDPLTYAITAQPADGTLTGTGANRTYTPNAGFTGNDSFQFTVTDAASGLVS